jgi:hypothetical protein
MLKQNVDVVGSVRPLRNVSSFVSVLLEVVSFFEASWVAFASLGPAATLDRNVQNVLSPNAVRTGIY